MKQRIGSTVTSSNSHFLWTHYPGGLVTSSDYSERLEEYPFFPRHQQVHTHTHIQKVKKLFPLPLLFTIDFAIYSFFFDTRHVLPMALGKLVKGISNCFVYETLLWASLSLYNNSNQYIMLWLEELVTPGDPPSLIRTPPPAMTPSETIRALAGFI